MPKKKKQSKAQRKPSAEMVEKARRAIAHIAMREGTTPEMVRKHIQLAMINGLVSDDPAIKAAWARIPKTGDVPTPEEVIAYYTQQIQQR